MKQLHAKRPLDRILHMVRARADEVARAISEDFGNRSRHETLEVGQCLQGELDMNVAIAQVRP